MCRRAFHQVCKVSPHSATGAPRERFTHFALHCFLSVSGGKNVSRIIFQHSLTPEDSEGFFLEKLKCIYERKKCFCAYSEFFTLRFMPVTQRTKKLRKKSKEIILSPVKKHQHILTCCSDWRTYTTHFQNFKFKKSLFHKE